MFVEGISTPERYTWLNFVIWKIGLWKSGYKSRCYITIHSHYQRRQFLHPAGLRAALWNFKECCVISDCQRITVLLQMLQNIAYLPIDKVILVGICHKLKSECAKVCCKKCHFCNRNLCQSNVIVLASFATENAVIINVVFWPYVISGDW